MSAAWEGLEYGGNPRITQVGALQGTAMPVVVINVGSAPAACAGEFGSRERDAFEDAVVSAVSGAAALQPLVLGGQWLHKGSARSALQLEFREAAPLETTMEAASELCAEGLSVPAPGGITCTLPCSIAPGPRPAGCVTVVLRGQALCSRQGAVAAMLRAVGYGPDVQVLQEFFGAMPASHAGFANTSAVVAFVRPPTGDEGLA